MFRQPIPRRTPWHQLGRSLRVRRNNAHHGLLAFFIQPCAFRVNQSECVRQVAPSPNGARCRSRQSSRIERLNSPMAGE